jgi:hypothetical protein
MLTAILGSFFRAGTTCPFRQVRCVNKQVIMKG